MMFFFAFLRVSYSGTGFPRTPYSALHVLWREKRASLCFSAITHAGRSKRKYSGVFYALVRNTALRGCLHGGRKILALGRPQRADHPSAICFLYSVYMQKVVLGPSARIFLEIDIM